MIALSGVGPPGWSGPVEVALPLVGEGMLGLRLALSAAVVVGLLAAVVVRARRRDGLVRIGFALAAAMSLAAGALLVAGAVSVTLPVAAGWRALVAGAAVGLVTAVLWRAAAGDAGRWAPAALVFALVGRDGVEAGWVLSGYAGGGLRGWVGLAAGVLTAAALAAGLSVTAARLRPGVLRGAAGVVVIAVNAGVLADGVGSAQQAGWLPAGAVLDGGGWSSWWTVPGALLRVVFHLTPAPTALQFAAWAGYLVAVPVALRVAGRRGAAPLRG
ncbi:hypothetical protein [Mycobacterium sp. 1274756.6]|uniref:hypothetical protein n=1 Tax=Mycobacterium sp. 1274756.6 TaxID=1834076 RepID=UPI000ACAB307|nr:hypothetical protein [Mycobacterium sp. 1274756.6]